MAHDNILRFKFAQESTEDDHTEFWIVTEYHELGSLHDYLKKATVSWEELCRIAFTMARLVHDTEIRIFDETSENPRSVGGRGSTDALMLFEKSFSEKVISDKA